jgi:hypothetical protein
MSVEAAASGEITTDTTRAIAKDAYLFAFAMLENYQTMYKQAVDTQAPEYIGGFGHYRHYSEPFTPDNKDIVTPNNDTPYSWAWLDLRAEPWVLSVPAVPKDRYYVCQWFDLFTHNFAYVGVRATGFDAGHYLFAGPRWQGDAPPGITRVFNSETDVIGTLTRTALNGPEDVPNVKAIQSQMQLRPLSGFLNRPAPPPAPFITFPPYDKARGSPADFIAYLNFLLAFAQPPFAGERAMMARFATIGIGPGKPFDASTLDTATRDELEAGVADAKAALEERLDKTFTSSGMFGSRAELGDDYIMRRNTGASKGLYGNSDVEAWYGGYVGDGRTLSRVRFPAGQLPPARFFWSATLYTLPDRLLYANPKNRYSIGDRTTGVTREADGSLLLYVGHESPGPDKESNWLPAPAGHFSLVYRIYGPSPAATRGEWKLPPLESIA